MSKLESGLRLLVACFVAAWLLVLGADRRHDVLTLVVLAFNAVPAVLAMYPWQSTSLLRFLRLACGAAVATAGALFMLSLETAVNQGIEADGASGAALLVAIASGVVGTWAADLTVARRAEEDAARRHRDLLEQISSGGSTPTRTHVRIRDLLLVLVAIRLVRRR